MTTEALDTTSTIAAWRSGDLILQPAQRRLLRGGVVVDVEDRVFDLIVLLAHSYPRALDLREVTLALWGPRPVSEGTLRQLVHKARRAVGDDGDHQTMIRTRRGASLQWIAPLEPLGVDRRKPVAIAPAPAPTIAPVAPAAPVAIPAPPRSRSRWLRIAAAAVLSLTAVGVWVNKARAPEDAPPPRVAIEPFDNATGDAALDWTKNGLPGLLGSLVEQGGGLDVVNTAQVAHAWTYKPQQGRSHEQQLRFVTGADVLIGGKLIKLADKLYELNLQVQTADGSKDAIQVDGEQPGILAADAVARVRKTLKLTKAPSRSAQSPADPFLAETYARGLDLAAQGKMAQARIYFKLCAENNPDFLPGRLNFGAAQIDTTQLVEGEKTLHNLLQSAQQRRDATMIARTLSQLSQVDFLRHDFADSLALLRQGSTDADHSGDVDLKVSYALQQSYANNGLKNTSEAQAALDRAHVVIEKRHLHDREAEMYRAYSFIASTRTEFKAEEAADRAALASDEAVGNELAVAHDRNNLAISFQRQGRIDEAVPLLAHAYAHAGVDSASLTFGAGDNLADVLLTRGVDDQAFVISDNLMRVAQSQQNKGWQALTRLLQGGIALYRDDPTSALTNFRAADSLTDARTNPSLAVDTAVFLATAMYSVVPRDVPTVAKRVDAIVAEQKDATFFLYSAHLVNALAAAANGSASQSMKELEAAAAAPHADDIDDSNLRMVAFLLGRADKAAAALAVKNLDIATCNDATLLHSYALWADAQGDTALHQRIEDRIAALRKATLAALSSDDSAASRTVAGRPN